MKPHTHINYLIKQTKLHLVELTSDLHMLIRDLRILSDNEKVLKTANLNKLKVREIAGNLDCIATDVSYLSKEISERVERVAWIEVEIETKSV